MNLLYVNLGALVLYKGAKIHFNQAVSDTSFAFYMIFLGFSPYFYAMYTDIPPLPVIAWQIFLALDILQSDDKKKNILLTATLGVVTGVVILMRPPGFVLLIAFFMVLFLKGNAKKMVLFFLTFLLSFGLTFGAGNYLIKHQREVTLLQGEGLSKGALLFVNLGLTQYGHNQEDMKKGLLQYVEPEKQKKYNNGMFKTEYIVKEIKRRLAEFTPLTFLWHLTLKQSITVSDGALGWPYTAVSKEKTAYINPLYTFTKNNMIAEWIRQFILTKDHPNYSYYNFLKQLVWILLSIGFFLVFRYYRNLDSWNFLSLAVFGGFLFLLVFEGGKTRYLIQFLPQIFLLSSLGLTNKKQN
ncbi:membrane protein [Streptococcus sp. DD10]|nr:membrane protein [Streptococcus sp. DD10]